MPGHDLLPIYQGSLTTRGLPPAFVLAQPPRPCATTR